MALTVARALRPHGRSSLVRNAYALLTSSLGSAALGILYWGLAARLFPAAEVGLGATLLTTSFFVVAVAQLGLNTMLTRYVPIAGAASRRLILQSYGLSAAVGCVLGVVTARVLAGRSDELALLASATWTFGFAAACAVTCVFLLQDSVLAGMRQSRWVAVENIGFGVVKIVVLLALAAVAGEVAVFASWNVPVAVSLVPVSVLIFHRLLGRHLDATRQQARTLRRREILTHVSGNYPGSLFLAASVALVPLLVLHQLGAEASAFFYIAWSLGYGLQFIAMAMSTSLTVEAAFDEGALRGLAAAALRQTGRLLIPAVALVAIAAEPLMGLFGDQYADSGAGALRLLALAALPHALIAVGLGVARVQHRAAVVLASQAAQCAVVLGLTAALLPRVELLGAGLAWLAAQSVVAIMLYVTVLGPLLRRSPAAGAPLSGIDASGVRRT